MTSEPFGLQRLNQRNAGLFCLIEFSGFIDNEKKGRFSKINESVRIDF
ncbi:hypothetical protein RCN26_08145 [Escherichia marmotae]|nr:hypothetical protein [Escherichia marmotae]MED9686264.1 hypothetical protein [Escherichia marmotae]